MEKGFQAGGAVQRSSVYIERSVDTELHSRLAKGEYCYILAPRQIGKSSLRVRTKWRLEQDGVRCATLDLNQIGGVGTTLDEWFLGLIYELSRELKLGIVPEEFWDSVSRIPIIHRWTNFLRDVVLREEGRRTVIFVDEIDFLLGAATGSDDFLASIRSCFDRRVDEPSYERLTFCLIGVALATDLVNDPRRTPFNIGHSLRMEDFSRGQLNAFAPAIRKPDAEVARFLDSIYAWTSGHPYMTQKLCLRLIEGAHDERPVQTHIDECVSETFLQDWHNDSNLATTDQFFAPETNTARCKLMLDLYEKLISGEVVISDETSPAQLALHLSGIAAPRRLGSRNVLQIRNPIFKKVFNREWMLEKQRDLYIAWPLQLWQKGGKNPSSLLQGENLRRALAVMPRVDDLSEEEEDFLEKSRHQTKESGFERRTQESRDLPISEHLPLGEWSSASESGLKAEWSKFFASWSSVGHIYRDFKTCATDILSLLRELDTFCRTLEAQSESLPFQQRRELLERVQEVFAGELFPTLSILFDRIEDLTSSLSEDAVDRHSTFLRQHLHPYVLNSPFIARAYHKPLGYAGDYELMDMLYRQRFDGPTLFAKLLNAWILNHKAAQARRSKVDTVAEILLKRQREGFINVRPFKLLSVGGGAYRVIEAFLKRSSSPLLIENTTMDFNEESLQHEQFAARKVVVKPPYEVRFDFVKKSVHQILKQSNKFDEGEKKDNFHFIYCSDLSEYLNDRVVRQLISALFPRLAENGALVFLNCVRIPGCFVWQSLLEWQTLHRGISDLANLVPAELRSCASFSADETGNIAILQISRNANQKNHIAFGP